MACIPIAKTSHFLLLPLLNPVKKASRSTMFWFTTGCQTLSTSYSPIFLLPTTFLCIQFLFSFLPHYLISTRLWCFVSYLYLLQVSTYDFVIICPPGWVLLGHFWWGDMAAASSWANLVTLSFLYLVKFYIRSFCTLGFLNASGIQCWVDAQRSRKGEPSKDQALYDHNGFNDRWR